MNSLLAMDIDQIKNITTAGAFVPVVVGLIIFKFAANALIRAVVMIVALGLGLLIYAQRAEIQTCYDNYMEQAENLQALESKIQCTILGYDINLDPGDLLPTS